MNILALDTDEKGNLWIGGIQNNNGREALSEYNGAGLFKYNISTNHVQELLYDPKDDKSLSSNLVLSLLVDKTGVLWVGTAISGVNIYDKSVIKFSLLKTGPEEFNEIKNPIRDF